jgi:hypothetical protein
MMGQTTSNTQLPRRESESDQAMSVETDTDQLEAPVLHDLKNHLSVIVGFCEMVLKEVPETDPKHDDLMEIRKAGNAAMALLPELSRRIT